MEDFYPETVAHLRHGGWLRRPEGAARGNPICFAMVAIPASGIGLAQALVQQFPLGIPKGAARWPPEASPSTPGVVVSSRIAVGPLLAGQGFRFFRAAPYRQTSPPLACVSPASKGGARCWGGRPDGGGMIHGMRAIIILTPGMIGHRNFFPVWAVNSGGRVSAF